MTATSDVAADPGQAAPRRAHRSPASAAEDAAVQRYLQGTLAISAAAARALTLRSRRPTLLQLSDCEDWVSFLLLLAGGDSAFAHAILHRQPDLFDRHCDQPQLDQMQQCLTTTLGVTQPQLRDMFRRRPPLLFTSVATVSAAAAFLLAHHGGNTAAAQQEAVTHPHLLTASMAVLQGGLLTLTEQLGVPPDAALGQLHKMVRHPIQARLDSRRQWLQQQGFTEAQVLALAVRAPPLFSVSTDILQRRLATFTQTYGIPADSVRAMLVTNPGVWTRDLEGQLSQAKLQYWQQELGYSLSDLPLAALYLTCSLSHSASRHWVLRDLLSVVLPPQLVLAAFIPSRGGASPAQFGRRFFSAYVKQHGSSSRTVQDVLQPLCGRLSQAAHQELWAEALQARPPLASSGRLTPQHRQLYSALDSIAERDWPLSAHGTKWTAVEAQAKAADRAARAAGYAVIRADRATAPRALRSRPTGASRAQRSGTADAAKEGVAGNVQASVMGHGAAAAAAVAATAAPALTVRAACAPSCDVASTLPAGASAPSPTGAAPAASPPAAVASIPEMATAPATATTRPAPRRRATKGPSAYSAAVQGDRQLLVPGAAEAAHEEQAGTMAGGTRRKAAGRAKVPPGVASS